MSSAIAPVQRLKDNGTKISGGCQLSVAAGKAADFRFC